MLVHANEAHIQDHIAKLFQRNEVGVLFEEITNTGYVKETQSGTGPKFKMGINSFLQIMLNKTNAFVQKLTTSLSTPRLFCNTTFFQKKMALQ